MPERDVQETVWRAVVHSEFEKLLLNPSTRSRALDKLPGLTPDERNKLMGIDADSLRKFAQATIDLGLARQ